MDFITIEELESFAFRKSFVSIFAREKLWLDLLQKRGKLAPFNKKQINNALAKKGHYLGEWKGRDCYIEIVK